MRLLSLIFPGWPHRIALTICFLDARTLLLVLNKSQIQIISKFHMHWFNRWTYIGIYVIPLATSFQMVLIPKQSNFNCELQSLLKYCASLFLSFFSSLAQIASRAFSLSLVLLAIQPIVGSNSNSSKASRKSIRWHNAYPRLFNDAIALKAEYLCNLIGTNCCCYVFFFCSYFVFHSIWHIFNHQ